MDTRQYPADSLYHLHSGRAFHDLEPLSLRLAPITGPALSLDEQFTALQMNDSKMSHFWSLKIFMILAEMFWRNCISVLHDVLVIVSFITSLIGEHLDLTV